MKKLCVVNETKFKKLVKLDKHSKYIKGDYIFVEDYNDKTTKNKIQQNYLYNAIPNTIDVCNIKLLLNKFLNFRLYNEGCSKILEKSSGSKSSLEKFKNNNELIKDALEINHEIFEFDAITDSKLIIGLGVHSVNETSILLEFIHGVPYIPGQAIKGVFRNYIINKYFDSEEELALENSVFCDFFGCNKKKGNIVFLDAFPVKEFSLETDIISTHYSEYYQGNDLPLDNDKINLINFLVVKDTKFSFALAFKNDNYLLDNKLILNHNKLITYIEEMFEFCGLGAKTSIGYGFFEFNKDSYNSYKTIRMREKEKKIRIIRVKKEKELKDIQIEKKEKLEKLEMVKINAMNPSERVYYKFTNNFSAENLGDLLNVVLDSIAGTDYSKEISIKVLDYIDHLSEVSLSKKTKIKMKKLKEYTL